MVEDNEFTESPQKIEEMRITIEDLEALKELNDELEENHVETEKALQEDIGECQRFGDLMFLRYLPDIHGFFRCQGYADARADTQDSKS